jgi:hypothetical protein
LDRSYVTVHGSRRNLAGTTLLANADICPKELHQRAALDDTAETLLGAAVR